MMKRIYKDGGRKARKYTFFCEFDMICRSTLVILVHKFIDPRVVAAFHEPR